MSHIAMVRSSARKPQQEVIEATESTEVSSEQCQNDLSQQLSVISVSSDNRDLSIEDNIMRGLPSTSSEETSYRTESRIVTQPKAIKPQLKPITSVSDVDAFFDEDLHQLDALQTLEEQWFAISSNLERVLDHLQQSGSQVTKASESCLDSLVDSIDKTCDKVDGEVESMYHLITKCEELTTKLSIIDSFKEEIKALRKSLDTLEGLYKTRTLTSSAQNR